MNVMEEVRIAAWPNGRKEFRKVQIIDVTAILTLIIMTKAYHYFHQVGIWCEPIVNYQYPVEVITFQIIPRHTFIHTLQLKQIN